MEDRREVVKVLVHCHKELSIPSLGHLKLGKESVVSPHPSARDHITWKGPLAFLQTQEEIGMATMEAARLGAWGGGMDTIPGASGGKDTG